MRKIFISLFIIFFILTPIISFAKYIQKNHTTYFGTTDSNLTLGWDAPVTNFHLVTGYEIKLYHVEREVDGSLIEVGRDSLSKIITLPRTGHFIVYIRSVNTNAIDESKKYSPWADSSNPLHGMVNNERKSWWLYGHVAKPGAISFGFPINEGP